MVEELYALISDEPQPPQGKGEGIVAFEVDGVSWPVVCRREGLDIMRAAAKKIATDSRKQLRIVRFSRGELIEVIGPTWRVF